jgi:hypothetical protein
MPQEGSIRTYMGITASRHFARTLVKRSLIAATYANRTQAPVELFTAASTTDGQNHELGGMRYAVCLFKASVVACSARNNKSQHLLNCIVVPQLIWT